MTDRGHDARAAKILAVVCIGTYLTALDVTVVTIAFRSMHDSFRGVQAEQLPWVLSSYNIAFAAGLLTAGRMADSFGRKRAFLSGIAIFSVASMAAGAAPTVTTLVAARVVQAIGAALIVPSGLALVLPEFAVERRSFAVGVTAAVGGLGAATGPTLGGLLVSSIGWRSVFYVNVPICVVAIAAGSRLLHERRDESATRPDVTGAVLATMAVALLTWATLESTRWGIVSTRTLGVVGLAVAVGVGFVRRTRRQTVPVLDLGLLRLRFAAAANLAGLFYAMGFYALNFVSTQWLQEVWHWSAMKAGAGMLATPGVSVVVAIVAGRRTQRHGHVLLAVPGLALLALASLWLAMASTSTERFWTLFFPAHVTAGAGIGLSIATLSSAASAYLPPHRFAMGSALYATARQVGAAFGVAAVSALRAGAPDQPSGDRRSWAYVATTMVLAAVAMLALFRSPTPAELAASAVPPSEAARPGSSRGGRLGRGGRVAPAALGTIRRRARTSPCSGPPAHGRRVRRPRRSPS